LSIDGSEEGDFTDDQIDAYSSFINDQNRFLLAAEDELFLYYQRLCMDYRERFGEGKADILCSNNFREI
jgi:hypothetical protein